MVKVLSAYLEYSDLNWGDGNRYYQHQKEVIESNKNVIVLDAPTGSGKTLAALARVISQQKSTIFVYPTNSLVQDQVDAISQLLKLLGRRTKIIDGASPLTDDALGINSYDTILMHMTGASLEKLSDGHAKGSTMDEILTGTLEPSVVRIFLTNPDTIYLGFAGWYNRHGRLMEHILSFKCMVIDEFHLYSGPTLAKLFFMINLLRGPPQQPCMDLIYLSATHGDTLDLLSSSYPDIDIIVAKSCPEEGNSRRKIRWDTSCMIQTKENILTTGEEIEELANEIVRFFELDYKWDKPEKPKVKVLAVVSSVIFAVHLAKEVMTKLEMRGCNGEVVNQIHGLVPPNERRAVSDMEECILIGTSAIEVGVDFDVPFLIMEAHDLASFLQRFGRGGRHSPCESVLYLPLSASSSLTEKTTWSFSDFVSRSKEAFHSMPSYAKFLCATESETLLIALALAGSRQRNAPWIQGREFKPTQALDLLKSLLLANQNVQIGKYCVRDLFSDLDDEFLLEEFDRPLVKILAKHGFLRGTMNSVIAYMSSNLVGVKNTTFYVEIDILEALRLRGHLEPISTHKKRIPYQIVKRHGLVDDIFVIDRIERNKYPRMRISSGYPRTMRTRVYQKDDYRILTDNIGMSETANQLLHWKNAICYTCYPSLLDDYRIPRVYTEDIPGAVVIGDWALVVEYLTRLRRSE